MIIDDLLRDAKMSQYKLSKESGVAQATISDICSRKTTMKKCAAGTLYRIAKTLNIKNIAVHLKHSRATHAIM